MSSPIRLRPFHLGLVLSVCLGLFASQARSAVSASTVDGSTQLLSGYYANGQTGDVILENDLITIVISAIGHTTYQSPNGGTVIDAGFNQNGVDALGELYPYFDDDWPRQAEYTSLVIVDDGSNGGPAVVRAIGHDTFNASLQVLTEYSLGDDSQVLTMTTSVTNNGGSTVSYYEMGDAFHWGGSDKYAPGYGFTLSGTTAESWLAGVADGVSYGYCGPAGNLWGPHGSYWSDVNVTTAQIGPGETVSYLRYLVVGAGDIAPVVTIIHELRGTPVGTVACNVISGATGSPIAGAVIDALDSSGQPYLQMRTASDGTATTTLPAGDWRLVASAWGYDSDEQSLTVAIGGNDDRLFTLAGSGPSSLAIGDTLTVIQRPLLNIPAMITPHDTLEISCAADPSTTGWAAQLRHGAISIPLSIVDATYDASTLWWTLSATIPPVPLFELYDLRVTANGGIDDTSWHAVRVLQEYESDYYFVQITDLHLPDHQFSDHGATPEDSTETVDFREVIADLNIIHPEFVLITGDIVNEGELEDYLNWRCYTRAQRELTELQIPSYLSAGNHDLGGWLNTPPPDGTSRRNWWRFFGWPRLDDPPPGAPLRTQNYSFDYGPVHFAALEAYVSYDSWRPEIYGEESFIPEQLQWLSDDLASASASTSQVAFYHLDFADQIDLNSLGLEMALSGHTHSDYGSITSPPYDLRTNNVCDGERSYRLIRVSNGVLYPQATLSAGTSGENLVVEYSPANDGTHERVSAEVINNQPQRFDHAQLRFLMPQPAGSYQVTGGTLQQIDASDSVVVCYVTVDIQASATQTVTVESIVTGVPANGPMAMHLDPNHPNPFNPRTTLRYHLPHMSSMALSIYDLRGREVRRLVSGLQAAGEGTAIWDGRNDAGQEVASGIYFARLSIPGATVSQKLTLVR